MKNIFLFLILSLVCNSYITSAHSPGVWSVYGGRIIYDDEETAALMHRLSEKTGDWTTDLLNTLSLIEICYRADGILGEMVSYRCLNDFLNKTDTIIYIYDNFGPDKLHEYLTAIACEICMSSMPDDPTKDYPYTKFTKSIKTDNLTPHQKRVLRKITDHIKILYDTYINILI